jgi:serine acetyltransferase
VVFGYWDVRASQNFTKQQQQHKTQQQQQQSTMTMSDKPAIANQAAINRGAAINHANCAINGLAYQVGNRVVIWRGRWTGESGEVIQIFGWKLKVQTAAGCVLTGDQ